MSGPRIAFIDIETAPILATVWTTYEANAVWVERDTYIMCFAVKWAGDKKGRTHALPDYPSYDSNPHDDKALCADLWRVLDDADIIVAHNGDAFDIKKINSRLLVHGFKPPAPFKSIDTLKLARQTFKFDSNKLDNLGRYLGVGRKLPNTGAALWRGCSQGDPKAWATMRRYNLQDVVLLESVYERLKAWGNHHPDLRLYGNAVQGCPTCSSPKVQRRGVSIARSRRYQRFQCQGCGAWFSGAAVKDAA